MVLGRPRPVLPQRARKRSISPEMANRMLRAGVVFFRKIEWFVKPRLQWAGRTQGRVFMGVLVILMATLMLIPIPFTNSFPALVIFLIGIGITEEDGLFAIAACFVGVLAALLYASLVAAFIVFGPEVITQIREYFALSH